MPLPLAFSHYVNRHAWEPALAAALLDRTQVDPEAVALLRAKARPLLER